MNLHRYTHSFFIHPNRFLSPERATTDPVMIYTFCNNCNYTVSQTWTGQGGLRPDLANSSLVGTLSRGELPVNPTPPASLDYSQTLGAQSRQARILLGDI